MNCFTILALLMSFVALGLSDYLRPGRIIPHDNTVINCKRYKRENNQHDCVLSPFSVEGPYFIPDVPERSDIRDGQDGVALDLKIVLTDSRNCEPIEGATIHLWNTNATGKYSGVDNLELGDPSEHGGPGGPGGRGPGGPGGHGPGGSGDHGGHEMGRPTPINNERFLRGYQITDNEGQVNFVTNIPGWYSGRTMHIHLEVYLFNSITNISYVGQFFFDDSVGDLLSTVDPYTGNTQTRLLNAPDWLFKKSGGQGLLNLEVESNGYKAVKYIAIDPTVSLTPNDVM